ncbi:hypothetical protein C8D88_116158 [Lentzea atacamensis]|uniref:Uncharacterized protein n=1 Tax=Lentzea atacamensis TaxID=531938 RepID=A0A316HKI0_9PSEU|nr:hypothetical protein C8D88_116158 [Lentzea atacamensis]
MVVASLAIIAIAITLLPRWTRRRVRVIGVARIRREMARHPWPQLVALQTPVDGIPSPRNEPSTGPEQPDSSPCSVRECEPPTVHSAALPAVRPRRRVVLSDPSLSTTLASGWGLR